MQPCALCIISTKCVHIQSKTQEFLRSSGVDVDSLNRSAGSAEKQLSSAATQASPTVNKFVNFLTTSDVATLGKTAAAALALYFLGPTAIKALFSGFRGYSGAAAGVCSASHLHVKWHMCKGTWLKAESNPAVAACAFEVHYASTSACHCDACTVSGPHSRHAQRACACLAGDVSPARAVDMVSTDGDAAIIDIRSAREKEATGTPDVPSSAKGRCACPRSHRSCQTHTRSARPCSGERLT